MHRSSEEGFHKFDNVTLPDIWTNLEIKSMDDYLQLSSEALQIDGMILMMTMTHASRYLKIIHRRPDVLMTFKRQPKINKE